MRYIALISAATLLLAVPGLAQAADDEHHPGRLLRMLKSWTDYAAARLQANDNVVDPFRVDGEGNNVINIDSIVLNIEVGDVMITENSTEGSGAELAHHLLEMLAQRGQQGPVQHPPVMPPSELHRRQASPVPEMMPPGEGPRHAPPAERGGRGPEFREQARRMAEAGQPPLRPEVMELLMQIPPDVEPEFVEFIMHVGQLAREYPEFREHLERLVERAHQAFEGH
jgi:hypothetical protein